LIVKIFHSIEYCSHQKVFIYSQTLRLHMCCVLKIGLLVFILMEMDSSLSLIHLRVLTSDLFNLKHYNLECNRKIKDQTFKLNFCHHENVISFQLYLAHYGANILQVIKQSDHLGL